MTEIFDLSDAAVDRVAAANPMLATYTGVAGYDDEWPDLSPKGAAAARALYQELRAEAAECAVTDDRDALAQKVLVTYCDEQIRWFDSGAHEVDLNNIASPHQGLRFIYGSMSDATPEAWEAIISRLNGTPDALAGFRETLESGRSKGNVVSRRQVEAVLEQGAQAIREDSSYAELQRRLASSPVDTGVYADRLASAVTAAKAAFAEFNDYLESTYLPDAALNDGVGEERYVRAAERFLGTQLDPYETYRWGWGEVERIWTEIQDACRAINPSATAEEVLHELNTLPEYAARDIDDFIAQMSELQTVALSRLEGTHFDVPEEIRQIDVQVEPAGGALAAHYVGPSEDFTRPGSVWYPVAGREHFPLFAEVTTAYHEGFPGHHLQVGLQTALRTELSRFQRTVVWYPGSGEGWALYAEHLMGELGYLDQPEHRVGLLSAQLLRACRVVIDIGCHLGLDVPGDVSFNPGASWNFDLALEMLTKRAFLSEDDARSEALRYFGWPGQAISYKLGERSILDLRDEWRSAAGADYDPKTFHRAVLEVGSVGLDLLEERVRMQMPRVA